MTHLDGQSLAVKEKKTAGIGEIAKSLGGFALCALILELELI
jgi:hypothetical protein